MKSRLDKAFVFGALTALALLNAGCEKEEDRKVYGAQACLDKATTSSEVNTCVTMLEGIESQAAYLIRCQSNFVAQGFTGQRMGDAFSKMKDNAGGTDPFVNIMGYLVFSDASLTLHTEDHAIYNCTRSGAKSLERLASAAKLATMTAKIAIELNNSLGGILPPGTTLANFNPNDTASMEAMKDAITGIADHATTAQKESFGAAALTMQGSFCNAGSTFEKQETCTYINEAVAGGNGSTAAVGAALFAKLKEKSN